MNSCLRGVAAVTATGLWVNASEFFRNEVLLKSSWTEHYQSLGLVFPSQPVNGMVWGLWGFTSAAAIFWVSRKFDLLQTALIAWMMTFVLMWLVIGNLHVLPGGLLYYAVPLSLLEVFVAAWLCRRMAPPCAITC